MTNMAVEARIDDYRFFAFGLTRDNIIVFNVESYYGQELNQTDVQKVLAILADMGKWEDMIKSGLAFLSDLRIITVNQAELETCYDKPVGSERYIAEADLAKGSCGFLIEVVLYLAVKERHKREARQAKLKISGSQPILPVEEISGQICNIAKWKNFKKALANIRS